MQIRFISDKIFKTVFFLISILFTPDLLLSQTYPSPLSYKGGIDTHLYKSDTVIFEATVMEDCSSSIYSKTFDIGLSMLHSPYLSMLYIPLKYGLNDNFKISFSLPYLTKTLVYNGNHYIKSGYGDTMLGIAWQVEPFTLFTSTTTTRITLPTGNVNAQDFDYYIPMGYGGYTASIQEGISTNYFDTDFAMIRFFISGLGIYYFTSSQKADQVKKYTFDNNYAWAVLAGLEFGLTENLDIQLKVNYIYLSERQYKDSSTSDGWVDANDKVTQINLLPFVKYQFLDDLSGQAGIIYPVKSTQDSDLTETYEAEWKFAFGIEKRFSDSRPAENGQKRKTAMKNTAEDEAQSINGSNDKKTYKKRRYRSKRKR